MADETEINGRTFYSSNPIINSLLIDYVKEIDRCSHGCLRKVSPLFSTNVDHLIRDWKVTLDTTGVVKSAIIIAMHRIPTLPCLRKGNHNSDITMITTAARDCGASDVIGSSANEAAIENNENGAFLRKVIAAVPEARTWALELVACHQTKPLIPKNIEGYFMSRKNTKIVGIDLLNLVEILSSAQNDIPFLCSNNRVMADAEARSAILATNNNWLKYHTRAASTAILVKKCIESLRATFPNMFSAETVALVDDAVANLWDKTRTDRIPKIVVAITYIYMKETRQLPDNWYQGNKAMSSVCPIKIIRFSTLFKKYVALSEDDAAKDAPDKAFNY